LLIMESLRDLVAEIRQETPPTEFFDLKKSERLARRQAEKDAAAAAGAAGSAGSSKPTADVTPVSVPSNGGHPPSPAADPVPADTASPPVPADTASPPVPADTASPPVAGRPQSGDEGIS